MDPSSIALLSMEEEIQNVEQVSDRGTQVRSNALKILESAVSKIEFTEDDLRDPKSSSSLLSILGEYRSIAEAEEKAAVRRVGVKAKLKEVKSSEQQAEATIALIRHQCSRDLTEDIDPNLNISDIELNLSPDLSASIKDTELRDDPDDLT